MGTLGMGNVVVDNGGPWS